MSIVIKKQTFTTRDESPELHFDGPVFAITVEGGFHNTNTYKIQINTNIVCGLTHTGRWVDLPDRIVKAAATDVDQDLLDSGVPLERTLNLSRVDKVTLIRPTRPCNDPITITAYSYHNPSYRPPTRGEKVTVDETKITVTDYDPVLHLRGPVFNIQVTGDKFPTNEYVIRVKGKYDLKLDSNGNWTSVIDKARGLKGNECVCLGIDPKTFVDFSRFSRVRLVRPDPNSNTPLVLTIKSYKVE